jgi:hypothetical protein
MTKKMQQPVETACKSGLVSFSHSSVSGNNRRLSRRNCRQRRSVRCRRLEPIRRIQRHPGQIWSAPRIREPRTTSPGAGKMKQSPRICALLNSPPSTRFRKLLGCISSARSSTHGVRVETSHGSRRRQHTRQPGDHHDDSSGTPPPLPGGRSVTRRQGSSRSSSAPVLRSSSRGSRRVRVMEGL